MIANTNTKNDTRYWLVLACLCAHVFCDVVTAVVCACHEQANPSTAYGILQELNIPPGGYLIQTAATSVVGHNLITLAKHFGIKTINMVRKESAVEELKRIGYVSAITELHESVQCTCILPCIQTCAPCFTETRSLNGVCHMYVTRADEVLVVGKDDIVERVKHITGTTVSSCCRQLVYHQPSAHSLWSSYAVKGHAAWLSCMSRQVEAAGYARSN